MTNASSPSPGPSDPLDDATNWVSATVVGQVNAAPMKMRVDVPKVPVHPRRLLPIYQQMTDTFVHIAVQQAEAADRNVTCRAGCGACCRQLVPISEIEARQLSELVADMPEERRNEIHRRFEAAHIKLREAHVLEKLEEPDRFSDQALEKLPSEYFQQAIPCPFLENESCSIHADRPLACREYLVTSPADYCAQPDVSKVQHVRLPAKMSSAVMRLSRQSESRLIPYVPMILALEWVTRNPDEMAPRKGTEILTSLVESLFGQEVKANGANDSPSDSDAGANDAQ